MTASNPSRFLASTDGDYGLALKMFWGGLVEAFRDEVVLYNSGNPSIEVKQITSGRSHQFMMLADTPDPEIHTPGDELLGQQFEMSDGTITVDDILVAHHDVPLDQFLLSHVDIVPKLGVKAGQKLARTYDQRLFNLAVNSARASAVTKNGLNVHNGGNKVQHSTAKATRYAMSSTGAQNFRDSCANLAQLMDEDFVPEEGRTLYITPYIRRVCSYDTTIFDVRYSPGNPNNLDKRAIGEIEGFTIRVAKGRIPATTVASYTGVHTKYNGIYTEGAAASSGYEPVAVALCGAAQGQAAIGVVQALGITPHMSPDHRRNTMFIKAQMMIGAGQMHVWNAGVIEIASS